MNLDSIIYYSERSFIASTSFCLEKLANGKYNFKIFPVSLLRVGISPVDC